MQKVSSLYKHYKYTEKSSQHANIFEFTTDSGVVYGVYFVAGEQYFGDNANYRGHIKEFGFDVVSPNHIVEPLSRDVKIKYTILAILKEYMDNNIHSSIIYVCDYSDGRQHKRSSLFNRWFEEADRTEYMPDVPITRYITSVEIDIGVKTDIVLFNLETCQYKEDFVNYLFGN